MSHQTLQTRTHPGSTGTEKGSTTYAFRRAALSMLQIQMGNDITKAVVHHEPRTNTLNHHYSNLTTRLDVVGVVSGNERKQWVRAVNPDVTPHLFRPQEPFVPPPRLSEAEARRLSSGLHQLCTWRDEVIQAQATQSSDCKALIVSRL
jgi:hypothetical protein